LKRLGEGTTAGVVVVVVTVVVVTTVVVVGVGPARSLLGGVVILDILWFSVSSWSKHFSLPVFSFTSCLFLLYCLSG
jgi:hypothetical protein